MGASDLSRQTYTLGPLIVYSKVFVVSYSFSFLSGVNSKSFPIWSTLLLLELLRNIFSVFARTELGAHLCELLFC